MRTLLGVPVATPRITSSPPEDVDGGGKGRGPPRGGVRFGRGGMTICRGAPGPAGATALRGPAAGGGVGRCGGRAGIGVTLGLPALAGTNGGKLGGKDSGALIVAGDTSSGVMLPVATPEFESRVGGSTDGGSGRISGDGSGVAGS